MLGLKGPRLTPGDHQQVPVGGEPRSGTAPPSKIISARPPRARRALTPPAATKVMLVAQSSVKP